jgi:EmrB/QacA subfamily drug resistance transporter
MTESQPTISHNNVSKNSRSNNMILLVLFVGVLMGALDIAIVGPALPSIEKTFVVDERLGAWIFTIYVLFNLIGTPLMAKLSDRFGRRSVYITDVLLFALGSATVAFAPNFTVLLVGRAIQALGAGGIFPVASAVIGDTFPPERRGSVLGLIGAVFGMAFLLGPLLAAALLGFGWHWLFLINLPIALIVIVMAWRYLPSSRALKPQAFDWAGVLTLGALLASVAFAISQLDSGHFIQSFGQPVVWGFLLAAVFLFVVFANLERSAPDPVIRPQFFQSRQVVLATVFAVAAGLGEAALVFLPSLAVTALGMGAQTSSFMLLPVVLALAIGAPVAGRMLDRLGSRVVIMTGLILLALGTGLYWQLASYLIWFIVAGALVGFGLASLLGAPLRYILLNEAAEAERASAQGLLTAFTSIGQLLSGALVGAIAASQGGGAVGYQSAFLAIAGVSLVMVMLAFGLKSQAQERSGISV